MPAPPNARAGGPRDEGPAPLALPDLAVDGALVAHGLGLDTDTFRTLMRQGRIASLCERGVGADLGRYRVSFFHGKCCLRLVLDDRGNVLQTQ